MSRFEKESFNPFDEHGKEQESKIKDSWLESIAEGYSLWPKSLTPGVSIFATDAVLRDPPENWNDFFTSTLNPKQITKLEAELSKYHKKIELPYDSDRGIPSLETALKGHIDRENPPADSASSIQLLWMDTTDYVGNKIIELTLGPRYYKNNHENVNILQNEQVFTNPELLDFERAKTILATAKRSLVSKEGLELSELAKLGGFNRVKIGNKRHTMLLEKYMQRFEEIDPFEKRSESLKKIADALGEKLTPMTNKELFSAKEPQFMGTVAGLMSDLIEKSLKNEGLGEHLGNWDSF